MSSLDEVGNGRNWNMTVDLNEIIESFQCSPSKWSVIPSLIYIVGIVFLVHHIISNNIRPQLYRRIGREFLLQIPWQEILIGMMIYQCIKMWLSMLILINTMFTIYEKRLLKLIPPISNDEDEVVPINKDFIALVIDLLRFPLLVLLIAGVTPIRYLIPYDHLSRVHPYVQSMLQASVLRVIVCVFLSCLPLLAVFKLKEKRPIPHFMLWMGPIRRDRTELGASGYYLERPLTPDLVETSSDEDILRKSCSVGNISLIKPRHMRPRARKSVSM